MIKVGQVYKNHRNEICVITSIDYNGTYIYITNTGYAGHGVFCDNELIAEYPTWQEAVNSKEFNEVSDEHTKKNLERQ